MSEIAARIGIERSHLYRKLKQLGIDRRPPSRPLFAIRDRPLMLPADPGNAFSRLVEGSSRPLDRFVLERGIGESVQFLRGHRQCGVRLVEFDRHAGPRLLR